MLDELERQMKQWRDEIALKKTVDIFFALADAQRRIERINEVTNEGGK